VTPHQTIELKSNWLLEHDEDAEETLASSFYFWVDGLMLVRWFKAGYLQTSEVRHLRLDNLDLKKRQLGIEQGKGLQDRIVFLSAECIAALQAYLAVRGPALSDHVFIFRHWSLRIGYCRQRLRTFGQRCGVFITPHQLRFSCATLLLNADVPILTIQWVLGHRSVQTTLRYTRLYDDIVVREVRRAMDGMGDV